jgi:two-component sensor histidine kinase
MWPWSWRTLNGADVSKLQATHSHPVGSDDRHGGPSGQPLRRPPAWLLVALGVYVAAAFILLPLAANPGPEAPALTPVFATTVFVTELVTSYLLFVQFQAMRTWPTLLLAAAYLYAALMAGLHLLAFPGALLPGRTVIGTLDSAPWAFVLWMGGYAMLTLAAVLAGIIVPDHRIAAAKVGGARRATAAAVVVVVLCCGFALTVWVDRMPPLMEGGSWTPVNRWITYAAVAMVAASIALILLFLARLEPIFLWLSLAMTAVLFANILGLAGGGRYTIGWSVGRMSWMVSASVLFLFFMGEFARQQRSLARARDVLEQRVLERTADLSSMVRQRDLLLREVHHRVKNNLQMTDSLIDMEARRIDDGRAREALAALRNRVHSLGLVHQQLMMSEDLETFSIAPFLQELSANLAASLAAAERGIVVSVHADPVWVDLDFAIPAGLIATELVINAMKHARARTLTVEFRRIGEAEARLSVSDDDPDAAHGHHGGTPGTGSRIIAGLVRQLRGRMEVSRVGGTRVEIVVPLPARVTS